MKHKNIIFFLIAIFLLILLVSCGPLTNLNQEPDEIDDYAPPNFEWRDPNPGTYTRDQPFYNQQVDLTPPTLCQLDVTLLEVSYTGDGLMTLVFASNNGAIPPGEYVAHVDQAEGLYLCEIAEGAGDQLRCTGPALPPGTETTIWFGELATDQFASLLGGDGNDLYELLGNRTTSFDAVFDFQLANQTAASMGMDIQITNLQDAYTILGTYVSLSGFPGFDQMTAARQLLSTFPPKIEFLLPETCKAFNEYAGALEPRQGTPQYYDHQWAVVSTDRFELFNPNLDLFELFDVRDTWQGELVGLPIPSEVYTCGRDMGWPYATINDTRAFINFYFEYLQSVNYQPSSACMSDMTRSWIKNATNGLSDNLTSADPSLSACAISLWYTKPLTSLASQVEFIEWLMKRWAASPESITPACTAMFASDIPVNLFEDVQYYAYMNEPLCTTEQLNTIQQAISQFNWEIQTQSCDTGIDGSCEYYDPACQEIAFVNNLLRDGTIDGPSTCISDFPQWCLAFPSEQTYVPPAVWECAVDTCMADVYPLQRGEGVYGFAQFLNMEMDSDSNTLPASCNTLAVVEWVEKNKNCSSENYGSSIYDYYQCGAPYDPQPECIIVYTGPNTVTWSCSDEYDPNWNCPSCATVYQCAEGDESIFCGEPPEEEDPGYWGQMNQCANEVEWGEEITTYQHASNLIQYLISTAPFLRADQIPPSCRLSVAQTLPAGMNYGDFLTGITIGGTVQGSAVCTEPFEITIPDEPVEEAFNRCTLFEEKTYSLNLLSIAPNTTALTLYVSMSGGVPGLETEIAEDDDPWEYSALLGGSPAGNCSFQGYANRLYCNFNLPESYMDTVRPLEVYVNGCLAPIYSNSAVSIIPLESGSGSGNPGNTCVKPPHPDPQDNSWQWNEDLCIWEQIF
jgi:hypothetical protein